MNSFNSRTRIFTVKARPFSHPSVLPSPPQAPLSHYIKTNAGEIGHQPIETEHEELVAKRQQADADRKKAEDDVKKQKAEDTARARQEEILHESRSSFLLKYSYAFWKSADADSSEDEIGSVKAVIDAAFDVKKGGRLGYHMYLWSGIFEVFFAHCGWFDSRSTYIEQLNNLPLCRYPRRPPSYVCGVSLGVVELFIHKKQCCSDDPWIPISSRFGLAMVAIVRWHVDNYRSAPPEHAPKGWENFASAGYTPPPPAAADETEQPQQTAPKCKGPTYVPGKWYRSLIPPPKIFEDTPELKRLLDSPAH